MLLVYELPLVSYLRRYETNKSAQKGTCIISVNERLWRGERGGGKGPEDTVTRVTFIRTPPRRQDCNLLTVFPPSTLNPSVKKENGNAKG